MTEPFIPTEELLSGDYSGSGRKQLLDELVDMEFSIKRAMDAGLSMDEMSSARALMDAVEAGKKVVESTWNKLN